jgi:hypothetical protein
MEALLLTKEVSLDSGMQTPVTINAITQEERIEQLAYALWQYRGSPIGSPEEDWRDAEKQILRPQAKAASMVGAAK